MAAYWNQSWGKSVGEVATILGTEPVPTAPPGQARHCSPDLQEALESVRPSTRLDATSGSEAERLIVAGSTAVAVRRIVAGDRYVLHRGYPSPRALFGVDLLAHDGAGASEVCLPWGGELIPTACAADLPARPSLSAHVRPGRYPEPYGTLRPSLARLEAGHLLATAGLTAQHGGLDVTTTLGGVDDLAGTVALATVGSGDPFRISAELLSEMVQAAALGHPVSLGQWLARRTSGSSMANLVTSTEVTPADTTALDEVVARGMAILRGLVPTGLITAHRTVLRGRGMTDRTAVEVAGSGVRRERRLTSTAAWASALGYTWSIDPVAWEKEFDGLSRGTVHVFLGWLCQWVCLGAAGLGLAARPARNFDEGSWAQDLNLPTGCVPGYQVWIRPIDEHEHASAAWTTYGRNA